MAKMKTYSQCRNEIHLLGDFCLKIAYTLWCLNLSRFSLRVKFKKTKK